MKILQIGKFYPPYLFGGIETVSANLHIALQNRADIQADFLGFLPHKYKSDIKVDDTIYLCKTNLDKFSVQISWSFFNKFRKNRNNYDIILINMPHPVANLAWWLYPPKKAKIVLYWHSDIIKQQKLLKIYRPFLVKLLKKSSLVIGPTKYHVEQSDFTDYFCSKSKIIPYILSYKVNRNNFVLDKGKKVIFACGRLIYYKGFEYLIDAARYLDDDIVIHIGGSGILYNSLKEKIELNNLRNKVFLLGRLSENDLKAEYKNCYLYCFPSIERGEMMGMVQFEALSYGKPVISTNIPRSGVVTINKDNETGYIVPIKNSRIIAEKINLLSRDNILYELFCNNAIKRINEYTSIPVVEQYITAFKDLLSESYSS